ncbi:MAG TPA: sugar nucleotide-binding protein [Candidatus Andersenbacteria bacterium]|nr:sugar nucleotide-binding protein [Candidatus Andersenbacteria bacterium]
MNYVLGGNGFIGRNVVKTFGALPIQHDLLDDPTGKLDQLKPGDIIFHAAHAGSVDDCAKNPSQTRSVNVDGSIRFLAEARKQNAIPLYFSTNTVFDGGKPYYKETDLPNPNTEYGRQKREVEEVIMANFPKYYIIRMTKVYGPGSGSFMESWMDALLEGKEIQAAHDMYAAPVYIDDVMKVIADLLAANSMGIHHVSGPVERSMEEIAKLVIAHTQADPNLLKTISIADLNLIEKRPLHNSLACDTVRDIPEILQHFYH